MAELSLSEGVSAFVKTGDEPAGSRRFGSEVAPAVRELVAAGRGR